MRLVALLFALVLASGAARAADLPRVLFLANPMSSDNDVIRRGKSGELSVAERNFTELSCGVFDLAITQNGADVTAASIAGYQAVVFFTAGNPPSVDIDG